MPPKTSLWSLRPWVPYINSSDDPSLLAPPACVNIENRMTGVDSAVKKRPGIDMDWDDQTAGSYAIVGASDYWYPSGGSQLQAKVSIKANGVALNYDPDDGTTTTITNSGTSISSINVATMTTYQGKLLIAFDGANNRPKKYAGSGNLEDLLSRWGHTTVSRTSSDTTRTVVLGEPFKGVVADYVKISGMGSGSYNGTFAVTSVSTTTLPNDTIQFTGTGSLTEGSTADTAGTVDGLAPNGAIISTHQGRVLLTEKGRNYRLHWCQVGDQEVWGGYGDSGAMDFDPLDNDPIGITGVFPTFNGDLFVAKNTKLYRVRGLLGYHTIELVSSSIGCVSQESIAAIDKTDIIWASNKGIHSLAATEKYGDYEEAFISKEIQKSFNEDWAHSRKKYLKGRYYAKENVYLLGTTESALSGTKNNCVWVYHIGLGKWISRWPNVGCESVIIAQDADGERPYLGSSTGRIYKTFDGDKTDTTEAGVSQAVTLRIKTGNIFVTEQPYTLIGFKKVVLFYQPKGTQTIAVNAKIDNNAAQSLAFDESGGGTPMGATFIMGTDLMGSSGLFAPYTCDFEGYGRFATIELSESSQLGDFTVTGIGLEYQPMGVVHATDTGTEA